MRKREIRHVWPDEESLSGAAFARVDTTISCVLTRFRLRSCLSLIPFYFAFRRIRREASGIHGLLRAAFLVENLRTCYTLSLWKNDLAITEFAAVRSHIHAANSAFGRTFRKDLNRSEFCSAQFRLWAVSCYNLTWHGLDMEQALDDQWQRRQELARQHIAADEISGAAGQ